jgi:hypothetical protein
MLVHHEPSIGIGIAGSISWILRPAGTSPPAQVTVPVTFAV